MLTRHRDQRSIESSTITVVRDIVEIVAIVAAGIWAFYVFVYENRIKPALLAPDVTITGTMQRVGTSRGLDAIRLQTVAHNVGTTAVKFLAYSVTIVGSHVVQSHRPWHPIHSANSDQFVLHYRIVNPAVVYRLAYLTHDVDSRTTAGLHLQPGGINSDDELFYVPSGRYDRLTAIFAGRLMREDAPPQRTTLTIRANGMPQVGGDTSDSTTVENDQETIATLALPSAR
jgi:hypothetical protein